jgi:hypothetical protein
VPQIVAQRLAAIEGFEEQFPQPHAFHVTGHDMRGLGLAHGGQLLDIMRLVRDDPRNENCAEVDSVGHVRAIQSCN